VLTNHNFKIKNICGHIDGVIEMIEEERYCIDISNQLLAIISLLKKANISVNKQTHRNLRKRCRKNRQY